MEPEQSAQLEFILGHLATGVAILGCADLRFLYVNPYLQALIDEPWRSEGVVGHTLEEIATSEVQKIAIPLLREVCATDQRVSWTNIPYEGFLAARGRTYWNVSIEPTTASGRLPHEQTHADTLLITLEEVTDIARSRLYLNAIQYISSAIAGPYALPLVLDRILQSVQDLVGSTRCAVLLLDNSVSGSETASSGAGGHGEQQQSDIMLGKPPTVVLAAQKGVHIRSQDWRPLLSDQVLLGRVMRDGGTLVIEDTTTEPEMTFPLLDDNGTPRRPGSVLCVPIFELHTNDRNSMSVLSHSTATHSHIRSVIGTIEIYHRRARGFPAEEVVLLEQFAQQAGLAIQHARLFRRINRLARDANRSVRQQKNVMQAIPDGVIIYDHRWRVADFNLTIRQLLGWSDSIIGLPITGALSRSTAVFDSDFGQSAPNLIGELDRRALSRQIDEIKLIGADSQEYTIRRSYAPIHDDLGNVFAFVVIYHDVTEQALARERIELKVAERTAELAQRNDALLFAKAALELESARMELLLERLPSGVMLISANDKSITLINHQAAQLLQRMGFPVEVTEATNHSDRANRDVTKIAVEDVFRSFTVYGNSGSVVPYEEQPLFLALHEGKASEAELHFTASDDQSLYLLMSAAALRDADGNITSGVLVLHEITRLKTLERAREDFFTTMAHELKTPLANIRAHLSALQANDYKWSAEKQRDFLQTADEQVERLVRMINHFLDASRVEAGALRLELEPILLPELIEDLQERLEALITTSKRRLEISLAPHLPAVQGDYELIMSVLVNLLSNAFRYAPEGDAVRLEVEAISNDAHVQPATIELRVIDRGPGLSLEQQAALFTRFSTFAALRRPAADSPGQPEAERRKTNTRWSSASGLGLYISQGIVEAHGSTLTLKSSPGEGATFSFTLAVASLIFSNG
ncbi:MAG: sensor histidine kinase [Ktedonobacteraceae bacterium]